MLIKLRAVGMTPIDLWLASGAWKPMPATFPMVLCADGAGVVEGLGTLESVEMLRLWVPPPDAARRGAAVNEVS